MINTIVPCTSFDPLVWVFFLQNTQVLAFMSYVPILLLPLPRNCCVTNPYIYLVYLWQHPVWWSNNTIVCSVASQWIVIILRSMFHKWFTLSKNNITWGWGNTVIHSGYETTKPSFRADARFASSQWETALQSNAVSHWLGANLDSALSDSWLLPSQWETSLQSNAVCYWLGANL